MIGLLEVQLQLALLPEGVQAAVMTGSGAFTAKDVGSDATLPAKSVTMSVIVYAPLRRFG